MVCDPGHAWDMSTEHNISHMWAPVLLVGLWKELEWSGIVS